ncbi:hypothetical protein BGZ54_007751 [Gamsiella multidivaricata]|nr:hypothetical protein BGZ54_007751 [Gamsiella multidivaricata]
MEEDQALISKIYSNIEQLPESDRLQSQYVILYSDTLCPILKYHAELFSEIMRVLPGVIDAGTALTEQRLNMQGQPPPPDTATNSQNDGFASPILSPSNILALIVSPKSDTHIKVMLPEPFHLDLIDRIRMADIQAKNSPPCLRRVLLVDDSWARLQVKHSPLVIWRSTDAAREHYVQSFARECQRLQSLLACIAATSRMGIGPMDLICVVDQFESEVYGVPAGIRSKVIFIVTKDREERPKAVALKTSRHWIDRIFLRSGYDLTWIHANVIPLYVELPGASSLSLAGQRVDSTFRGTGIYLSSKRPQEAYVRVKVREGEGEEVLERSVLEEIGRTEIFEMQAIRKPMFEELMENMSLESDIRVGGRGRKDNEESGDGETIADTNPFL